jgi:hypothetical protein
MDQPLVAVASRNTSSDESAFSKPESANHLGMVDSTLQPQAENPTWITNSRGLLIDFRWRYSMLLPREAADVFVTFQVLVDAAS